MATILLSLAFAWPVIGNATPRIARQSGESCGSCHFKDLRSLNAHGRRLLHRLDSDSGQVKMDKQPLRGEDENGANRPQASQPDALLDSGEMDEHEDGGPTPQTHHDF